MSNINLLLGHAREKIHGAMAVIQTNLQQVDPIAIKTPSACPFINKNYEWDGGDSLLAFDARGAGTEALSQSMAGLARLLYENPKLAEEPYTITPEVSEYLEGIANARGISMEQAEHDYVQMLALMNAAKNGEGIKIEPTDEYGTLSHLRFGHVAGVPLGIDAAFASLMSPEGGLTTFFPGLLNVNVDGKGWREEILAAGLGFSNEALAYHSPTHDALGFLKNKFDIGPGYCYVPDGADCLRGNENGLGGQLSGITHWEDKLGVSSPLDHVFRATEPTRDVISEGAEAAGEIGGEFSEAGREISDEWSEAGEEILREAREHDPVGVALEFGEGLGEVSWQAVEGTGEIAWEIGEGAVETGLEVAKTVIPWWR